jgi:hypothetical protein
VAVSVERSVFRAFSLGRPISGDADLAASVEIGLPDDVEAFVGASGVDAAALAEFEADAVDGVVAAAVVNPPAAAAVPVVGAAEPVAEAAWEEVEGEDVAATAVDFPPLEG